MRFFQTLLIFSIMFVALSRVAAGSLNTPSGVQVMFPQNYKFERECMELISEVDAETTKFMRHTFSNPIYPVKLEMHDEPLPERFELKKIGTTTVLRIGNDFNLHMNERKTMQVLSAFFMLSKTNIDPAAGFNTFPTFIADGMADRLKKRHERKKKIKKAINVNVVYLPAIRTITLKNNGFPLRSILNYGSNTDGAVKEFYYDSANFTVEYLYISGSSSNNLLKSALLSGYAGNSFDDVFNATVGAVVLKKYSVPSTLKEAEPKKIIDHLVNIAIKQRIFSHALPFPAEAQKKMIADIRQFTYQPNREKPEIVTDDITNLPFLFKKIDAARFIANSKLREFSELLYAAGPVTFKPIENAMMELNKIDSIPPEECSFLLVKALDEVERSIEKLQKIELFLENCENQLTPPLVRFRHSLERPGDALPPAVNDYLAAMEEKLNIF